MSIFSPIPREGDWIRTTRPIKVTMSDYLLGDGAGIKPGTRGVVLRSAGWNSLEVRLDGGLFGSSTIRVKPSQVRVIRRDGGIEAFAASSERLRYARVGVALALALPLLYFVVSWFIHGGTKEGLIVAVLDSFIYGVIDLIGYAISNPLNALLYLLLVTGAWRFAFR